MAGKGQFAVNRRIDLSQPFARFHLGEFFPDLQLLAGKGYLYKNNIAGQLLRKVVHAHNQLVALDSDPVVVFLIVQIFREIVSLNFHAILPPCQ